MVERLSFNGAFILEQGLVGLERERDHLKTVLFKDLVCRVNVLDKAIHWVPDSPGVIFNREYASIMILKLVKDHIDQGVVIERHRVYVMDEPLVFPGEEGARVGYQHPSYSQEN
jgi:hypothetical protein